MYNIDQVIDQFDEYIDNSHSDLVILRREYAVSQVLKDLDHKFYCKKLDEFIYDNYMVVHYDGDMFYEPNGYNYYD
jgi:hypothetical protein